MGNSANRDARRLETIKKERRVLELRLAGATFEQCADGAGYANKSAARKAYARQLESHRASREDIEQEKQRILLQLDAMLLGIWRKATSADNACIDRALRIIERRVALLGLDAPKRAEHTGKHGGPISFDLSGLTDAQIERLNAGDVSALAGGDSSGAARGGETGEDP